MLRDASELITPAVAETIAALALRPEDAAAVQLARLYALRIDQATVTGDPKIAAWAARWIGPELLKALEALGATPAARAALSRGQRGGGEKPKNQLDIMREQRAKRTRA